MSQSDVSVVRIISITEHTSTIDRLYFERGGDLYNFYVPKLPSWRQGLAAIGDLYVHIPQDIVVPRFLQWQAYYALGGGFLVPTIREPHPTNAYEYGYFFCNEEGQCRTVAEHNDLTEFLGMDFVSTYCI